MRGGEPAGGPARRLLPASRPAGPEALVAVTSTDAARERPQGVAARAALRLRGRVGRATAHPAARAVAGRRPPVPWNFWAPGAPCLLLAGRFQGRRPRSPGRRGALAPAASRGRGAQARRGRGGGSRARCGGSGWLFLSPPPHPPRLGPLDGPVSGAPALSTCPGPRQAFPSLLPGPASALFCFLFKTFPRVPSSRHLFPPPPFPVGFPGSPAGFAFELTHTCHYSFRFRHPPPHPPVLVSKTPIHFPVSSPPHSYLPKGFRHPAASSADLHPGGRPVSPAGLPLPLGQEQSSSP